MQRNTSRQESFASFLSTLNNIPITFCSVLGKAKLEYPNTMTQFIGLTLGVYREKRLSAAQKRFTRSCEILARVRKSSRNRPALQFNIEASGGQQVNLSK